MTFLNYFLLKIRELKLEFKTMKDTLKTQINFQDHEIQNLSHRLTIPQRSYLIRIILLLLQYDDHFEREKNYKKGSQNCFFPCSRHNHSHTLLYFRKIFCHGYPEMVLLRSWVKLLHRPVSLLSWQIFLNGGCVCWGVVWEKLNGNLAR